MSILDKIKSIEFNRNRNNLFGIKSAILFGHSKDKNYVFPLLYISKPKHITKEDYEILLNSIEINIIRSK